MISAFVKLRQTSPHQLPVEVTTKIKEILTRKLPVMLEGPGKSLKDQSLYRFSGPGFFV